MDAAKKKKLEVRGWKVGSTEDFLSTSDRMVNDMVGGVKEYVEEITRLRTALEKYADENSWDPLLYQFERGPEKPWTLAQEALNG